MPESEHKSQFDKQGKQSFCPYKYEPSGQIKVHLLLYNKYPYKHDVQFSFVYEQVLQVKSQASQASLSEL